MERTPIAFTAKRSLKVNEDNRDVSESRPALRKQLRVRLDQDRRAGFSDRGHGCVNAGKCEIVPRRIRTIFCKNFLTAGGRVLWVQRSQTVASRLFIVASWRRPSSWASQYGRVSSVQVFRSASGNSGHPGSPHNGIVVCIARDSICT